MKLFFFLLVLSSFAFAETWELQSGHMTYEVSTTLKNITGESRNVKGKIVCEKECEFILGIPVNSFTSSDSNRDSNMLQVTEAAKYQVTSATGKIATELLTKPGKFSHKIEVNFHGVKNTYDAQTEVLSGNKMRSQFILKLDAHKIEKPSFLGMTIKDDVPMTLVTEWKK